MLSIFRTHKVLSLVWINLCGEMMCVHLQQNPIHHHLHAEMVCVSYQMLIDNSHAKTFVCLCSLFFRLRSIQ